jgi:solute carrier organic anion transporter family, member 5A
MNYIAAAFITMGVLFDAGVWRYVKDLKIFDEEVKEKEIKIADKQDEAQCEKKPLS